MGEALYSKIESEMKPPTTLGMNVEKKASAQ